MNQDCSYGFLYLANLESEWFTGSICLSYIFNKSEGDNTPIDVCERSAASVQLPIDPLDEMDRFNLLTLRVLTIQRSD